MTTRRPVSFFRSVRFRIAAWNTLAVVAVVAISLAGLRQAVRWTLLHEVDAVLREDAAEVRLVLEQLAPKGLPAVTEELGRKATGHQQHRWYVRLFSEDQEVWRSSSGGQTERVLGQGPTTSEAVRSLAAQAPPNPLGVDSFQIGSSLELLRADFARIDRLVVGALLLLLLVAPACGYWLAGLATRNLERLSAAAAVLQPTRMGDRLPYRGVDDEFDRLAGVVNLLLDRIAEFLDEKRIFLADAAHELRTPVAAIRSTLEVSLETDRTNAEYRDLIEELLEETESLGVLISQLLLLSEATATVADSSFTRVNLSDATLRSASMFRGVAESTGVELETLVTPDVFVRGVARHLSQVVNNLVDNAIKYTSEGGRVSLVVSQESDKALLVVRDTGQGIASADQPHIFDRFFRSDRARSRTETAGTGLGLSICQTIVAAHGGEIHCKSEQGLGSEFVVTLPSDR